VRRLKTQTNNAISYGLHFLSFFFVQKEAAVKVQAVYLFGSAVRGQMEKKSDLDLFFECSPGDEQRVRQLAEAARLRFVSSKEYAKWKLLKFTYPFSFQIGKLKEWGLKSSIASEGMLLFSRKLQESSGQRKVLFLISYPQSKRGYIRIKRLLFGRSEKEYRDSGLVKESGGEQLNSTSFLIPKEAQTRMIEILAGEKVDFSMREMILVES